MNSTWLRWGCHITYCILYGFYQLSIFVTMYMMVIVLIFFQIFEKQYRNHKILLLTSALRLCDWKNTASLYPQFGQGWSSVRGSVGSTITSPIMFVSSLKQAAVVHLFMIYYINMKHLMTWFYFVNHYEKIGIIALKAQPCITTRIWSHTSYRVLGQTRISPWPLCRSRSWVKVGHIPQGTSTPAKDFVCILGGTIFAWDMCIYISGQIFWISLAGLRRTMRDFLRKYTQLFR